MESKSFPQALRNEDVLNNQIHALSGIDFHHSDNVDTMEYATSSLPAKMYVDMLDALALILISTEQHEVAATGLIRQPDRIIIVWAKNNNKPASPQMQEYINKLKSLFESGNPDQTLGHVVQNGKRKVASRIKKAAASFGLANVNNVNFSNLFGVQADDPNHTSLEKDFHQRGLLDGSITLSQGMDIFVRRLARSSNESDVSELVMLVKMAWILTSKGAATRSLLNNERLSRLRKVGDYLEVCLNVTGVIKQLSEDQRQKIEIVQLKSSPAPRKVSVFANTVTALNTWLQEFPNQAPVQNFQQLHSWYSNAVEGSCSDVEKRNIATTQHCELTVALYLMEWKRRNPVVTGPIEIGVSKSTCQWCYKYLTSLNNLINRPAGLTIVCRATHGKRPDGWMVPSEPELVKTEMLQYLGSQIQEIFDLVVTRRRKSDSAPLAQVSFSDFKGKEAAVIDEMLFGD